MAVVVTVAKGYDLGYIWKTQAEPGTSRTVRDLQAQREVFRITLQDRQASKAPSQDPGWGGADAYSSTWRTLGQDAILQPPKPSIEPSARILQRVAEHDAEPEPIG